MDAMRHDHDRGDVQQYAESQGGGALQRHRSAELGQPAAVGGQNELYYPYFPAKHRLAIRHGDTMSLYDTAGYTITSVSQQQHSGLQGLYFSSQQGVMAVITLPLVESRKA
jgi:hypothetical protein